MTAFPEKARFITIKCGVCNRPVDRMVCEEHMANNSLLLTVFCHGDKDTMEITQSLLGLGPLEHIVVDATAFQTKRLTA